MKLFSYKICQNLHNLYKNLSFISKNKNLSFRPKICADFCENFICNQSWKSAIFRKICWVGNTDLFWKLMINSTEPFYGTFYKSIKQFYGCWLNLLNIFEILTLSFVNKARPIVSAKPRMKMENKMKFLSQFLWIKFVLRTKLTALRN